MDYKLISALLEKNLANSAFRRGTSAHRLGLIQEGISDHLPIQMSIQQEKTILNIISWNILADAHLYNNFMNITGTSELLAAINNDNIYGGHEGSNKLYHYFSELGPFLYDQRQNNHAITFNKDLLEQFNSVQQSCSLLTRSRDPVKTKENIVYAERSRAAIAEILLDMAHEHAHEFKLAIQHSVDLIYHIKHEQGER